jgi:hypothetical protein
MSEASGPDITDRDYCIHIRCLLQVGVASFNRSGEGRIRACQLQVMGSWGHRVAGPHRRDERHTGVTVASPPPTALSEHLALPIRASAYCRDRSYQVVVVAAVVVGDWSAS